MDIGIKLFRKIHFKDNKILFKTWSILYGLQDFHITKPELTFKSSTYLTSIYLTPIYLTSSYSPTYPISAHPLQGLT